MPLPRALSTLLLFTLPIAPLVAAADAPEEVGHVATLRGRAVAERPGEAPRTLHCHDAVYEGDRVVTAGDARVGVLVGDLLAQVGGSSALIVSETPIGADLTLERGGVRIIDPRDVGAHARLGVLDTKSEILGNDLEGYIFTEKTGPYAMLCEWERPLPVSRANEIQPAEPGQCVIAKRREPLYVAKAHEERLGSPRDDRCPLGPMAGPIGLHLSPADVAAGPPLGPWSNVPAGLDRPRRSPCDNPGSGCGAIFEPAPITTGPFPGSQGTFPGSQGAFPGP